MTRGLQRREMSECPESNEWDLHAFINCETPTFSTLYNTIPAEAAAADGGLGHAPSAAAAPAGSCSGSWHSHRCLRSARTTAAYCASLVAASSRALANT